MTEAMIFIMTFIESFGWQGGFCRGTKKEIAGSTGGTFERVAETESSCVKELGLNLCQALLLRVLRLGLERGLSS